MKCKSYTREGTPCKLSATEGDFCWIHSAQAIHRTRDLHHKLDLGDLEQEISSLRDSLSGSTPDFTRHFDRFDKLLDKLEKTEVNLSDLHTERSEVHGELQEIAHNNIEAKLQAIEGLIQELAQKEDIFVLPPEERQSNEDIYLLPPGNNFDLTPVLNKLDRLIEAQETLLSQKEVLEQQSQISQQINRLASSLDFSTIENSLSRVNNQLSKIDHIPKPDLSLVENQLQRLLQKESDLENHYQRLQSQIDTIIPLKESNVKALLDKQQNVLRQDINALQGLREAIKEDIQELLSNVNLESSQPEIKEVERIVTRNDPNILRELDELRKEKHTVEQDLLALQDKNRELENQIANISGQGDRARVLATRINELEQEIENVKRENESLISRADEAEDRVGLLETEKEQVRKGLQEELDNLQDEIERYKTEVVLDKNRNTSISRIKEINFEDVPQEIKDIFSGVVSQARYHFR